MGNASRVRYEANTARDYTNTPTHIRIYSEPCGDEWPWHVDMVDEAGNYSPEVYRYATHAEAITVGVRELVDDLCENGPTITRDNQSDDVIYVGKWSKQARPSSGYTCFVSPDGIGRYYYDGINEAISQHGDDLPIVFASEIED